MSKREYIIVLLFAFFVLAVCVYVSISRETSVSEEVADYGMHGES